MATTSPRRRLLGRLGDAEIWAEPVADEPGAGFELYAQTPDGLRRPVESTLVGPDECGRQTLRIELAAAELRAAA